MLKSPPTARIPSEEASVTGGKYNSVDKKYMLLKIDKQKRYIAKTENHSKRITKLAI